MRYGYWFLDIQTDDSGKIYYIIWEDLLSVLETPIIKKIRAVRAGAPRNDRIPIGNDTKSIALEEGANTNCDVFCPRCSGCRGGALTWCRVRTAKWYKKHYIWCLCNRAQKIVIFFYDALAAIRRLDKPSARKKSRSRNALKDFLGDSKIKSMQTDGYNVYAEEIKERRNSAETNRVIADLCCRLNDMLNAKDTLGDLMLKAVNYLQSFWKQLMAWRNDGNYRELKSPP